MLLLGLACGDASAPISPVDFGCARDMRHDAAVDAGGTDAEVDASVVDLGAPAEEPSTVDPCGAPDAPSLAACGGTGGPPARTGEAPVEGAARVLRVDARAGRTLLELRHGGGALTLDLAAAPRLASGDDVVLERVDLGWLVRRGATPHVFFGGEAIVRRGEHCVGGFRFIAARAACFGVHYGGSSFCPPAPTVRLGLSAGDTHFPPGDAGRVPHGSRTVHVEHGGITVQSTPFAHAFEGFDFDCVQCQPLVPARVRLQLVFE